MRAAIAFALVACSSPPGAGVIPRPQQPVPLSNTPSAVLRAPSPKVLRGGIYGLTTDGMPAIAADGSRIVAAFRAPDGARGMPNLTIVVKDRRDTETDRHVVLSLDEADQMLDDAEGRNPALDARIARANKWLDDRHRFARFEPLASVVSSDRTTAMRDGVTVAWTQSHLRISDGTTILVDARTPSAWLPGPSESGTNVCLRTAHLGGAAIDRAKRLALVTIAYTADSDLCFEPPDQHHVVTW